MFGGGEGEKKRAADGEPLRHEGADGRARTDDLLITNQLLCQLSYVSEGIQI